MKKLWTRKVNGSQRGKMPKTIGKMRGRLISSAKWKATD
jgi:hypothetical protein